MISVIVPIYKVEPFIHRCVDSLLAQTYTDLEIILVDDGSPDGCPAICEEYAAKDARIKVVHKPNGGLSSARNAGLDAATGQYIGFVDGDDDVDPTMYEKMVNIIQREQVDFVMCDYVRVPQSGKPYLKTLDIRAGRYDKQDLMRDIFPSLIMGENVDYGPLLSVCTCLYRADFFKKNQLHFDEEVRWSEDNIFSAVAGSCADSFFYLKDEGLYRYHQNPGTITTSYRAGAWDVYCTMNRHLRDHFKNYTDYDFSRQFKLHMLYYACNCIGQAMSLPKKQAIEAIRTYVDSSELQEAFTDFSLPTVGMKLKLQLWLMKKRCAALLYYLKK